MSDSSNDNKKSVFSEATAIYVRPKENASSPPPVASDDSKQSAGLYDAQTVIRLSKTTVTQVTKSRLGTIAPPPTITTEPVHAPAPPPAPAPAVEAKVIDAKLSLTQAATTFGDEVESESRRDIRVRSTTATGIKLKTKARRAFRDAPNLMMGLIALLIFGACLIGFTASKRSPSRAGSSKSSAETFKAESPTELASESTAPLRRTVLAVQTTGDVLEEFDRAAAKTQTEASEYSRSGSGF